MTKEKDGQSRSPIPPRIPEKTFWQKNYYESSPKVQKIRDALYLTLIPVVMFTVYFGLQKVLGVLIK